jgi:hypothetical protein
MNGDTEQAIRDLTARLWALPVADYLGSGAFSRFCREHELWDTWREYRQLSEDKPDLYGGSVMKDAFSRFLAHIFHRRQEEFLSLFARLLADFSRGISCDLPVDDLKAGLLALGYPEQAIDHALFSLRVRQTVEPDEPCCPPKKRSS